ncbi:MAG: roadblock/LC7 domain-containing protein [Chthoniobacteraceae bacterium]
MQPALPAQIPAQTPRAVSTPQIVPELLQGMAQVEVAHLSLAAILSKLPQELSVMVAQMPDEAVTVALPVNTIHKQLPTGSVKMSLASLYRQAPAGTFTLKGAEDRRMVEVPLSEIFRHVRPEVLRRTDQRRVEVPDDAVALFGNKDNPYAMEPAVPEDSSVGYRPSIQPPEPAPRPDRTLRPSDDMRTHTNGSSSESHQSSAPGIDLGAAVNHATPSVSPQRVVPPPSGFGMPPVAPAAPAAAPSNEPPLTIELASLAGGWPEPLRSEVLALSEVKVALPAGAVTAGLAKGKVAFTWGQLRSWTEPPTDAAAAQDGMELVLPLKIVAPAFLRRAKPAAPRKTYEMDESIPALFSGNSAAPAPAPVAAPEAPVAPEVEKAPAAEIPPIPPPVFPEAPIDRAPEPESAPAEEVAVPASPTLLTMPEASEESPKEEAPATEEATKPTDSIPGPVLTLVSEKKDEEPADKTPAPEAEVEVEAAAPEATPAVESDKAPSVETPAAEAAPLPASVRIASTPPPGFLTPGAAAPVRTLGEILGQPEKTHWSPPDLVKATVEFEGVAGAIIALQEGFVVAADLPENIKADTMAAFLPQIFARLNNYASEMGLGEVGDLLTTTNGAQLQVHRFGEVYFAILGQTGEILPWEKIGPVVAELANQHRK